MIRNIVLDMGNVLLDYNPDAVIDMFCSSDEEKEVIRRELFEGPEWAMGDRGDIKDADRFDLVKVRVPEQFHAALKTCADRWEVCMNPLEGAGDFCAYVKEHGYGIYILSNASDLFYTYFPKFLPLDYFDGVFVSSDYHMLKPDPEIYRAFLGKYNLKGEDCLFIDDREDNVRGAREVGMNAFRFEGDYGAVVRYLENSAAGSETAAPVKRKHVVVNPYDAQWKEDFLAIREELQSALGELALRIEHVGSTSVEGLSAKPIIDIDVVIADETKLGAVIAALAGIGYQHEGNLGIEGREAFGYEGKEHLRKHHLYVCTEASPELRRHLTFRDYLRAHPDAVREYSRIKEEGAQRFPYDIDSYINYKSPWIEKIYREIGL